MDYSKRIQDNIDHLVICMMNVLAMNQLDTKTIDTIADTTSKLSFSEELRPFVQEMVKRSKMRAKAAEATALSVISEANAMVEEIESEVRA